MTSRTDVEKAKFSTTLCSLLAYTWWHDVDDKRYPRYRDSRWVDTVTHHEYSWRHLDRLTPHLAFSIVTLHHAWFVMRVLYCDTAPWQCTSLWCNPHHDTASSMSTHMICLHTWCVYKFHMSTHFFNLSVFLVKQPNLKFKPVCNYTPTLHVFSMAAPTVSVRAREQLIWACSSWNSQTWSSNRSSWNSQTWSSNHVALYAHHMCVAVVKWGWVDSLLEFCVQTDRPNVRHGLFIHVSLSRTHTLSLSLSLSLSLTHTHTHT